VNPSGSAEDRYAELVRTLTASDPDVSHPSAGAEPARGFGADALKVNGRIFAMLSHHRLVVKLRRGRVEELLAAGVGERFDPGHGRVMREWLSVHPGHEREWEALAREALAFGRSSATGRTTSRRADPRAGP
jgi:hypothetical protein